MRRYDDPVEVRRGHLEGPGADDFGAHHAGAHDLGAHDLGAPAQFLWRGRLWKVRSVLAHWRETGPWWQSAGVRAVLGTGEAAAPDDLLAEREVWRVEAGRGVPGAHPDQGAEAPAGQVAGVFELALDRTDGRWQLVGCLD